MTDDMVSLLVDIHPSNAKLTLFHDGNCFSIASTVSADCLWEMLSRLISDGSTRLLGNAAYDHFSSRFDTAYYEI